MRQNPGQRIRHPRAAIIAACVLVTAATGAVIAWRASHSALPQASCGRVITNRLGADTQVSAGRNALSCFGTAARRCKVASIGITEVATDTGTNYVFAAEPGGTLCQVTQLRQGHGYGGGGRLITDPITSTPCRMTTVTRKGVMLNCGGQDVLIPATVSPPRPVTAKLPRASCGSAVTHELGSNTQILSANRGALRCFIAAARACRYASIKVVNMGVDTGTDYLFTVEPGGPGCLVNQEAQGYSANFGGEAGPITETACHRTTVSRNGVVLACAGLDVLIPPRVASSQG